mgnify:CR=1 FL=1
MIAASILLLLAGLAAVSLQNLIRSTLALALAFAALGVLFFGLGAEFAGLVQILVNVGAVAVLIAFVVLITRPDRITVDAPAGSAWVGALCAVIAGGLLTYALLGDPSVARGAPTTVPRAGVAMIGKQLTGAYLVPLQMIGLLLTAALVGAGLLAADDHHDRKEKP